jgi:hypothetical protein
MKYSQQSRERPIKPNNFDGRRGPHVLWFLENICLNSIPYREAAACVVATKSEMENKFLSVIQ